MFSISSIVSGSHVDYSISREIAAGWVGFGARAGSPGGFLPGTSSGSVSGARRHEFYSPPPHPVYPGSELHRREGVGVVLGVGRNVSDHRRVARQRTQAVFQEVGELVLFVWKVFLAVEDRQEDVSEAGQGDSPACLAPFRITQVDQVQSASTSSH